MKNIYEIFEEFESASSKESKIAVLQRNNTETLRNVLQGGFHPAIKYVIDYIPEYTKSDSPPGMGYSSIESEFRRIYLFVEGSTRVDPNLPLERKMQILAQILESMESKEANIFAQMIMKKIKVKGLTPALIQEAFPGLLN